MAPRPPASPPTPPTRKPAMPIGPDLNRLPTVSPDRAAVMQDIRNGPKLRRVDPSLINDRSEANKFYQPETTIRKLIQTGKDNGSVSSRSSSVQSLRSVGFKTGATNHPAAKSKPPTPTARKGHHRSISSLSSASRVSEYQMKRSPSPSADYRSIMGLWPRAVNLASQQKSTENLSQIVKTEKVTSVKRQAPPAPVKVERNVSLASTIEPVDVIKYRDVTYQRNLRNQMYRETMTKDNWSNGGSQRSVVFNRVESLPKAPERRIRSPAPLPPTANNMLQNYTHAEFEAKFTFRMTSELPPGKAGNTISRKTYPSNFIRS